MPTALMPAIIPGTRSMSWSARRMKPCTRINRNTMPEQEKIAGVGKQTLPNNHRNGGNGWCMWFRFGNQKEC